MFSTKRSRALVALAALWSASACDDGAKTREDAGELSDAGADDASEPGDSGPDAQVEACRPDTSAPVPTERCGSEGCGSWVKLEPPGAQCSNGSQYKFFVNLSSSSNNLLVMFEGGGACWDYASCSGGARGAANRNGISDTHMERTQFMNLLRRDEQNPLKDWNLVFLPYCTGDVHTGHKVANYEAPDGGEPLTYRHWGHDNTLAVVDWIKQRFSDVPQLLVTGYSAGGIGALQNYLHLREALPGVQCGYLLNDSGPAFHSDGPSKQVQAATRAAWGVDALLDELKGQLPISIDDIKQDAARLNTALADKYPRDRLAMTVYEMDLNYSLYSYERFFPGISEAEVHEKWSGELDHLLDTFETRANLGYFVPYFRSDNCSHCVSIPPLGRDTATILSTPWLGTDIEQEGLNLRDYIERLLDPEQPLRNYREAPQPSEAFTPEEVTKCMTP
ncbi:MAG TPA: pectin acetylesterase-family hydrolase [Polyangiales bacterium]